MNTFPNNVQLVISLQFAWNNEPDAILEQECFVGVYDENNSSADSFYWFEDVGEIQGEVGDFTVHDFRVTNTCDNRLLKKLEAYDDYMTNKTESEGYSMPISIKEFLAMQINPIALSNLNLKHKRDLRLFHRFKELYLKHSIEVMDATELGNTPVCYSEWLHCEDMVCI